MEYKQIRPGVFLSRPNRFIAYVEVDGKTEVCHVKNTGRCRELLIPGAKVFVDHSDNVSRKTKYSLIAVQKGERLINMDSQAPNQAVKEWLPGSGLFPGISLLKPESVFGDSRFDFYLEAGNRKAFIEVKGVTLEENGVALFPDAPTERGVKHMGELCHCIESGFEAWAVFVIQMKGISQFCPNDRTHPEFGESLRRARACGVHLLAIDCIITESSMRLDHRIPIRL